MNRTLDCLVIGGGPAGLTAATYLARFRRAPTVIDAGASRAAWIPVSHNIPAFPRGLSGDALLARLREQATEYGATLTTGEVTSLAQDSEGLFVAATGERALRARRVLLATGGLDVEPDLPGIRDAVRTGLVRYCPICDAYEAAGQKIALIAYGKCRIREALLLRAYTADLTVLTLGQPLDMPDEERRTLAEAGIAIVDSPIDRLAIEGSTIAAWHMQDGTEHRFDTVYSALGTRIRSGLATTFGAATDDDGALRVDSHQQTTIPGLYAAGDVVSGLSQVSVASGQATIAATHMNASLPFGRF
jgi:thioredoxin reductase (NADPH)